MYHTISLIGFLYTKHGKKTSSYRVQEERVLWIRDLVTWVSGLTVVYDNKKDYRQTELWIRILVTSLVKTFYFLGVFW
jgi:hypothetical protein